MSSYLFTCRDCGKRTPTSIAELADAEEAGFVCSHCGKRYKLSVEVCVSDWKENEAK